MDDRSLLTVRFRGDASLLAILSDRQAPARTGGPVLVDGAKLKGTLAPLPRQVIVVILGASRLCLEPLATQTNPKGELMKLLRRVRL